MLAYFLMALLYCGVFFAFAMMASAIAKSSAMSIMIVLGIAMALLIIPQSSYDIAGFIVGPQPEAKWIEPIPLPADGNVSVQAGAAGVSGKMDPVILPEPRVPGWDTDIQKYYERRQMIVDTINTVSPMYNFGDRISNSILYKSGGIMPLMEKSSIYMPVYKEPTIVDSLAAVWINILALIIELIIPLVISYVVFLRADVR
jgi:ABC-2 type transport system permease protein